MKRDEKERKKETSLVGGGGALVELGEAHADAHGVLEELLGAAADAGLLVLVEGLAAEGVDAVGEAALDEGVVHAEAVAQLQLVDHGAHAELVLLRHPLQVAQHALVH
jgi:hypothetical protein